MKKILWGKVRSRCSHAQTIMLSFIITLFWVISPIPAPVLGGDAAVIDGDVNIALQKLFRTNESAKKIHDVARGVLVFPDIIKGGLIFGGQYGKGALRVDGQTSGYYQTVSASWGLQIGAQSFGYAMFFMTESGLRYLRKSDGWEVGVGPSVVVADEGLAKSFTTSTFKEDIIVFFFNQKGLMAGIGVQGTKISPIYPR